VIGMRASARQDSTGRDTAVRPLARIVVGIDFSEMSLATAQWVARHLGRDATLTLVHVITDPLLPTVSQWRSRQRDVDGLFRTRTESLRGALRGLAKVVGGANTGIEVRLGDSALQLAAYADVVDADLVVVGGTSRFHAAPRHETATTDRLLRHLTQPALLARNTSVPVTSVLAVLASDEAAPVLNCAQSVSVPSGARVTPLRLSHGRHGMAANEQALMILNVARAQRAEVIAIGSSAAARGDDEDIARVLARTATCSVLVVPHSARVGRSGGAPMTRTVAWSVGAPNDRSAASARS
jgi:nucleotide-binding universal stress UspA family protein